MALLLMSAALLHLIGRLVALGRRLIRDTRPERRQLSVSEDGEWVEHGYGIIGYDNAVKRFTVDEGVVFVMVGMAFVTMGLLRVSASAVALPLLTVGIMIRGVAAVISRRSAESLHALSYRRAVRRILLAKSVPWALVGLCSICPIIIVLAAS